MCNNATVCTSEEYEIVALTPDSDRVCGVLTLCDFDTQFIAVPPTSQSDLQCADLTVCNEGLAEIVPATTTTDRTCVYDGICRTRPDAFDLVFVLDGSGSVTAPNFEFMRSFTQQIVSGIHNVSPDGARIAAVLYGIQPVELFDFTAGSERTAVDGMLGSMVYPTDNQPTGTATALNYVTDNLLTAASGHRGAKTFVYVVTDGPASEGVGRLSAAVDRLKSVSGVEVVAVGIGAYSPSQIRMIGSTEDAHVFEHDDFDTVDDTLFTRRVLESIMSCAEGTFLSDTCTDDRGRVCSQCSGQCEDTNTYITGTCRGEHDFDCAQCSTTCEPNFFISRGCDGITDRTCSPCSGDCGLGQFKIECTTENDRLCQACGTICPPEHYKSADCAGTTDNTCSICSEQCTSGTYEAVSCDFQHDRVCATCSGECPEGTFETTPCSFTADRICSPCSGACPDGLYESGSCNPLGNRACSICAQCDNEEYETTACSPDQNRECSVCNEVCTFGVFEAQSCTPTSNRQCSECQSECDSLERNPDGHVEWRESRACSVSSDRECTACIQCSPMEFMTGECSVESDRTCSACAVCAAESFASTPCSAYADATCTGCSERCFSGLFESVACTPYSDRECSDCTTGCGENQFVSAACSEQQDTQCTDCSGDCVDGTWMNAACTAEADRECEVCDSCLAEEYTVVPCESASNRECAGCTAPCEPETYESTACTQDSNRVCSTCRQRCGEAFFEDTPCTPSGTDRSCTRISECTATEFELSPQTVTSDRICRTPISCTSTEYEMAAPTATTDRVCATLSVCTQGVTYDQRYSTLATTPTTTPTTTLTTTMTTTQTTSHTTLQTTPPITTLNPTATTSPSDDSSAPPFMALWNRDCVACSSDCPPEMYAAVACTTEQDRYCELCGTPCNDASMGASYEAQSCTFDHDRVCAECSTSCPENMFEATPCGATEDRTCEQCITECPAGQYLAVPCSAGSDAVCMDVTAACGVDQYESQSATSTSNRICAQCTSGCPALSFLVDECDPGTDGVQGSDRRCAPCSDGCPENFFQSSACSASSDRQCTAVSGRCTAFVEFEAVAPTPTSDRQCQSQTECDLENNAQFISEAPTPYSDRVCRDTTVCNGAQNETVAPTATSDRGCVFDGFCSTRNVGYDLVFLFDGSGSIGQRNFDLTKELAKAIVRVVGDNVGATGENKVRVGSTTFAYTATDLFDFNAGASASDVLELLDGSPYDTTANLGTATAGGLAHVANTLFDESRGYRGGHAIVVVITDGRSAEGLAEVTAAASLLHQIENTAVISVGIGSDVGFDELQVIADDSERVFHIQSFDELRIRTNSTAAAILSSAFSCDIGHFETVACTDAHDNTCNGCTQNCGEGSYQTGSCLGTRDFDCTECSGDCPDEEYIFTPCDGVHDRTCAPCSGACELGQFTIECSATNDRVCQTCQTSCPSEQTQVSECSLSADLSCDDCTAPCDGVSFYETQSCTTNHDRICSSCNECPVGTFESAPCTATSNRECSACADSCADGQYEASACGGDQDRTCSDCDVCGEEEYAHMACTPLQNRECTACDSECAEGLFETQACTSSSNRGCSACAAGCEQQGTSLFEAQACTSETDRVCALCSDSCPTTQFQTSPCSATADRVCSGCSMCAAETYATEECTEDADTVCGRCRENCVFGYFESAACTHDSDRDCSRCSTSCPESTFRGADCTPSADLECIPCQSCGSEEFETASCTEDLDRECSQCTSCGSGRYAIAQCSGTVDRVCADCQAPCTAGTYESTACSKDTDRECTACTAECDASAFYQSRACDVFDDRACEPLTECLSSEFETAAPTSTTDRVCDQCTACGSTFFIASACTASADTQCSFCSSTCASGSYQITACSTTADIECVPWTVCSDTQFERFEPSSSTDRGCPALTECAAGEYESIPPTSTSDRSCTPLRECRDLEEETVAPTDTTDRECACLSGYRASVDGSSCLDIDECVEGTSSCTQLCSNLIGSFQCSCSPGYEAAATGGCAPVVCGAPPTSSSSTGATTASLESGGGQPGSLSFGDSATLECFTGYQTDGGATVFAVACAADRTFVSDGPIECNNINECASPDMNLCEDTCIDTEGGYTCSCEGALIGFSLNADGLTCDDYFDVLANSHPSFPTVRIGGDVYLEGEQPHGPTVMISRRFRVHSSFTLMSTFRQTQKTGGFLFSKADLQGVGRSIGLYLFKTRPAVKFFYQSRSGSVYQQESAEFSFAFPLNDGQWHRLMLSVDGVQATLFVDGLMISTETLASPVEDCLNTPGNINCLAFVGMRQSFNAEQTSPFTGVVRSLALRLRTAMVVQPVTSTAVQAGGTSGPQILNVLDAGEYRPAASGQDQFSIDPPLRFPGSVAFQSTVAYNRSSREDSVFSVSVSVVQRCNSRGYLFAKTNAIGTLRYYALYSTGSSFVLYYKARGAGTSRVMMRGAIGDGLVHRVMLAIDIIGQGVVARLSVDDTVVSMRPLNGLLDICDLHTSNSADCPMFVGGRAAPASQNFSAWQLQGVIHSASVYTRHGFSFNPSIPQPAPTHPESLDNAGRSYINLLSRPQFLTKGGVSASTQNNSISFEGAGSILLRSNPVLDTAAFSVAATVKLDSGSDGYIFAKTDATGSGRFYALYYSNRDSRFNFFYTVNGETHVVDTFGISLASDGADHHVLLAVSGSTVQLVVDRVSSSAALVGPLDDCGAANQHCLFYLGQRASSGASGGAYRFSGTIKFLALYHTQALVDFPTFIQGN